MYKTREKGKSKKMDVCWGCYLNKLLSIELEKWEITEKKRERKNKPRRKTRTREDKLLISDT